MTFSTSGGRNADVRRISSRMLSWKSLRFIHAPKAHFIISRLLKDPFETIRNDKCAVGAAYGRPQCRNTTRAVILLRLRAMLEVSRYRAHASRALALRGRPLKFIHDAFAAAVQVGVRARDCVREVGQAGDAARIPAGVVAVK